MAKHHRKWLIMAAAVCSISMILIDQTILPVTLPTIHREITISELGLQWIINSYLLVLAGFVLAAGRVGDLFGHRRIICWGLMIFAIASALCGVSYSSWWFITARCLQGVGGAMLLPNTLAILLPAFPLHERGKAIGLYVGISSLFMSMGPFLGGIFTQYASWRYVFWINLPIAIAGLILTLIFVPKDKGNPRERFDWWGFIFLVIGTAAITLGLMQGSDWGWGSPWIWVVFAISLISYMLLVYAEKRAVEPLIDFSVFGNRTFMAGLSSVTLGQMLIMVGVFWAIYFQTLLGYSPATAGYISLLANVPIVLFAPLAGLLVDRIGPKFIVAVGFVFVIVSVGWFVYMPHPTDFVLLLPVVLPIGCGMTMVMTPSVTTAMSEIPHYKRGFASGTLTTSRQIGSTLGMAIMGVIFLNIQSAELSKALAADPTTGTLQPSQFEGLMSLSPSAVQLAEKLTPHQKAVVEAGYETSYVSAFRTVNLMAMIIAFIGLIVALILFKHGKPKGGSLFQNE